jgi:hypothetical protein
MSARGPQTLELKVPQVEREIMRLPEAMMGRTGDIPPRSLHSSRGRG